MIATGAYRQHIEVMVWWRIRHDNTERSGVYKLNSRRPKTDPCGTPYKS